MRLMKSKICLPWAWKCNSIRTSYKLWDSRPQPYVLRTPSRTPSSTMIRLNVTRSNRMLSRIKVRWRDLGDLLHPIEDRWLWCKVSELWIQLNMSKSSTPKSTMKMRIYSSMRVLNGMIIIRTGENMMIGLMKFKRWK